MKSRKSTLKGLERAIKILSDPKTSEKWEQKEALREQNWKATRKDALLHMRINSQDLDRLKRQAEKRGLKYQTYISDILKKVARKDA